MTAGTPQSRPEKPHNEASRRFVEHSSAQRINTDVVIVDALRAEYPQLHLTVVPVSNCNILAYASAGHAGVAPIDQEKERLSWRMYQPPPTRLDGGRGALGDQVKFGKYLIDWARKEFILYVADGRDGSSSYPQQVNQYLLSPNVPATNELLLVAGAWNSELHDEIWVFDQGFWQKSRELWQGVQKARWEDVILEESMKSALINDVSTFYDNRDTYERLRVPWKRGIIYYGPPGNGKTISIKALMHTLYERREPVPTLYVRSLAGFGGPEYSLNQIFSLARRTAPCLLVFEDLDSIVSDQVRSYFLNEVDGIQKNDGILMIGSTNHLERLDPGISKRPSRFDRKYLFANPDEEQRTAYMKYWQAKLADNDDIEFPDKLCPAVARITPNFSFAYLQEAIVASLLAIARNDDDQTKPHQRFCLECMQAHARPANGSSCDKAAARPFKGLYDFTGLVRRMEDDDEDLDRYILWREIKKQVRILKEELGEERNTR